MAADTNWTTIWTCLEALWSTYSDCTMFEAALDSSRHNVDIGLVYVHLGIKIDIHDFIDVTAWDIHLRVNSTRLVPRTYHPLDLLAASLVIASGRVSDVLVRT